MKAVILAGGLGTRISEETILKPKPMIEIGGLPIIWHVMKMYSHYGINEFIICCGYKGYIIKEYFSNYFLHTSDVTFDFNSNDCKFHKTQAEPWKVTLVDTGNETMTGGRITRIKEYLGDDDTFCLTYGDGVSDVDISKLIAFHKSKNTIATLTAIHPPERFGVLNISDDFVTEFHEKHSGESSWVNGGFFVFEPSILDYLQGGDPTILERKPLETLAQEKKLSAFKHNGFWYPMDTLRDKKYLEELWKSNSAPWKKWH